MFREIILISALVISSFGQFHNDQPFQRTQIFDMNDASAESLSANTFGNRLLAGGGKSGVVSILDIENLESIHVIDEIDFNNDIEYIAELATSENLINHDGHKRLDDILLAWCQPR